MTTSGISHIGLSVPDLDAAVAFWTATMGFELVDRQPSLAFLVHREGRIGLGLSDHGGVVTGPCDERRAGLDHLAFGVPDAAALQAWVRRLDDDGVAHSGVLETDAGLHLNLRGPDRFPIELFVLSPAMAEALGVPEAAGSLA